MLQKKTQYRNPDPQLLRRPNSSVMKSQKEAKKVIPRKALDFAAGLRHSDHCNSGQHCFTLMRPPNCQNIIISELMVWMLL